MKYIALLLLMLTCGCIQFNWTSRIDENGNSIANLGEEVASISINNEIIQGSRFNQGHHININIDDKSRTNVEKVGLICFADGGSTLENTHMHASKYEDMIRSAYECSIPNQNKMFINKGTNCSLDENGNKYQPTKENLLKYLGLWVDRLNKGEFDLLIVDVMCHGYSKWKSMTTNGEEINDENGMYNCIKFGNDTIYDWEFWNVIKNIRNGRTWVITHNCYGGTFWYNAMPRTHDYDPNRNSNIYQGDDINLMVWTASADDVQGLYTNMEYCSLMMYAIKQAFNKNPDLTYKELWELVKTNTYKSVDKNKNSTVQMFSYGDWNKVLDTKKAFR